MPDSRSRFDSPLAHILILFLVCLPYCINLGESSIWDANEAFYAETPREMLVSADYLAPHFNFQPRAQKPPLTYWAVLISYKIFGVSEFSVRLPGALAAVGVILFCYGLGCLLFNRNAALIGAVAIAATARVFILARRLPIDILLLFFLTGALYFLIRAIHRNDRLSWVLACTFISLGFLTKGPVAVFIPAATYLLWSLRARRFNLTGFHFLAAGAIFLCLVLPWYLLVYRAHGLTYIAPFFLKDNLGRFAAESFGPSRGLFYYFSVYAGDFFPWSLLFPAVLYVLWSNRKREQPLERLEFGFPLIWCGVVFLLFSLSKNKQEYYIAPMYPAAAVLLGGVIERWSRPRLFAVIFGFLALILFLLALFLPYAIGSFMPHLGPVLHYGPSLVLVAGSGLLLWKLLGRKYRQCFPAFAASLWGIYILCAAFYLPALERFRPVKDFCRTIDARSGGDDEAGYFSTALPSMVYYLRRPVFEEYDHEQMARRFKSERRVFCILSRADYAHFAGRKDLAIYVLDRRSRFSVKLGTLLNAGYFPGEELVLVSNRPHAGAGPTL